MENIEENDKTRKTWISHKNYGKCVKGLKHCKIFSRQESIVSRQITLHTIAIDSYPIGLIDFG